MMMDQMTTVYVMHILMHHFFDAFQSLLLIHYLFLFYFLPRGLAIDSEPENTCILCGPSCRPSLYTVSGV